MLAELQEDLAAQTYQAFTHHVAEDVDHLGPGTLRNELAARTDAEWLAFVDDDDRLLPNHLEALIGCWYRTRADVCYTQGVVVGRADFTIPHDCEHTHLATINTIPVTALVRREMFDRVGGFPTDCLEEDHGLWKRILAAGGTFGCDHRLTWRYRFHGNNRSYER